MAALVLKKTTKRLRKRSERPADNRLFLRRKNDSLVVAAELAAGVDGEHSERLERTALQCRHSDFETLESANEASKMQAKIVRVTNYWTGASQLIPNTFRLTCFLEEDSRNLLEYQDLSRKEVLAQFYSKQSGSFDVDHLSDSGTAKGVQGKALLPRKTPSFSKATFNN